MASNRHLGRILAFQSLFEYDFRVGFPDLETNLDEIIDRNLERYEEAVEDKSFVRELVHGVVAQLEVIDAMLQPIAPNWPLREIGRPDKCILRMALFELKNKQSEVPPKVVINEAVELAKAFGSDNSSKFVNGVLGTAYRSLVEGTADEAA